MLGGFLHNIMSEPAITPELVAKHGLTPEEFERIKTILGGSRTSPNSASSR
jgi:hypothetical protein